MSSVIANSIDFALSSSSYHYHTPLLSAHYDESLVFLIYTLWFSGSSPILSRHTANLMDAPPRSWTSSRWIRQLRRYVLFNPQRRDHLSAPSQEDFSGLSGSNNQFNKVLKFAGPHADPPLLVIWKWHSGETGSVILALSPNSVRIRNGHWTVMLAIVKQATLGENAGLTGLIAN